MTIDDFAIGMSVPSDNVYWHDGFAEYCVNLRISGKVFTYAVEGDEDRWVVKFRITKD